jgi:hypothetical protein
MPKVQVGAAAEGESRTFLKTIRALTRPRGFESHALRSMSHMRSQARFLGPALAVLAGAILAGCTGGVTSSAAHRATTSSSPRMATAARRAGRQPG